MRLLLFSLLIVIIGCNPKSTKKVVEKDKIVKKEAVYIKSNNIVFCSKTFDLREKITFLNDVYQAFHWGDTTKLKHYINTTVTISVQQGSNIENNYTDKSLSKESLYNWKEYLNTLCTGFGTSVCTKLDSRTADFVAETCISNKGIKGKSYFKYIHFDKIKGKFYLKGVGITVF